MEAYEWTDGGKELLIRIELFIQENGGRMSLVNKIENEERGVRESKWRVSQVNNGPKKRYKRKKRPQVKIFKGNERIIFKTTTMAARFIGTSTVNVRASVHKGYKTHGWNCSYIRL